MTVVAAPPVSLFVFGARGLLAGELLRLCELHPALTVAGAFSREADPRPHAHLGDGVAARPSDGAAEELAEHVALGMPAAVLLALPHGESARAWRALRERLGDAAEELLLVDLAADYRLSDTERYRAAYGRAHPDSEGLSDFVYGLPELGRARLRPARRVAAPGCFATALQLAVVPAARAGVLDAGRPWILNGVTGSSGSGVEPKPSTHHPHRHDNLWAYSVGGHRHEAELEQALAPLGVAPPLCFVACSGPWARGIHLTASLPLARTLSPLAARELYEEAYGGEPFVEVLAEGAPDLRSVVGSNRAVLAVHVQHGVLHVLLTLDNMIKGGAGQALQCLNLMLGLPETAGLPRWGLGVS